MKLPTHNLAHAAAERVRACAYRDGWRDALILAAVLLAIAVFLVLPGGCPAAPSPAPIMPSVPSTGDSGVTPAEAAELERYFEAASQRLRSLLLKPVGKTYKARAFRRARAAQLQAEIARIADELRLRSFEWVGIHAARAAERGRRAAGFQLAAMGLRSADLPLAGSLSLVDAGALRTLAAETAADLAKAADGMASVARSYLVKTQQVSLSEGEINRVLAGGVISGSPRQAARELREAFERVSGPIVRVEGRGGPRHFDAGYYAQMVARTKTRQAMQAGRHQRLDEVGIDLVRIVGRVSGNWCTAFLGQVFSLSGTHPTYPPYASIPNGGFPGHPNCSKSTAPFVEGLASTAERRRAAPLADAGRLLGRDTATAQRMFADLQLRSQVRGRYQA